MANDDDDDESATQQQELFFRFDPLLRLQLASIQALHALHFQGGTTNDENANTNGEPTAILLCKDEEKAMKLLKSQSRMTRTLQTLVVETVSSPSSVTARDNIKTLLVDTLADYLLLPCLAVLSGYSRFTETISESGPSSTAATKRSFFAKRSAVWSCIADAATFITEFIRITRTERHLPLDKTVKILVACAQGLPSASTRAFGGPGVLDRGEDCTVAILHCIETIVDKPHPDGLSETISMEAGDGLFLAGVSFCCVGILDETHRQQTTQQELGTNKNGITSEKKSDPLMAKQAVVTLCSLMVAAPSKEKWRGLFPGIFSVSPILPKLCLDGIDCQ